MSTVIINVHNDEDKELLKKLLSSTKFSDEVEYHEEGDEFTEEDIAEWDRRVAEYEKDPSKARPLENFVSEMKAKYGAWHFDQTGG
jgi:putative addiction module component (TIGR02574 family)